MKLFSVFLSSLFGIIQRGMGAIDALINIDTLLDVLVVVLPFMVFFLLPFILITIVVILVMNNVNKKKNEASRAGEIAKQKERMAIETSKIMAMSFIDLLRENELEQYCEIFEANKINDMMTATSLTDNDLSSIGISILGDRKKILSLIETKVPSPAIGSPATGTDNDNSTIKCPNCGSKNVQAISEVTGESKGFGCCKGGLGAILFGPIGFLCGLCGMGKGKTTTNTLWICGSCGRKFK